MQKTSRLSPVFPVFLSPVFPSFPGLNGAIGMAAGLPGAGCDFGACGDVVFDATDGQGQNVGHVPNIDLEWWGAFFSWKNLKQSQKDLWNNGVYKCLLHKNLPGLSGTATVLAGGHVASETADKLAPRIAGSYYHFTDARFTAWGRFSKVLVPKAAGTIRLWAGRANVAALAYTDIELARSGFECGAW